MNFNIKRDTLLKPLQAICGVVERRQSLPILSHVLLVIDDNTLSMTATDLEVEMIVRIDMPDATPGEVTLPARKFLDICRALPEDTDINLSIERERATLRAGKSRFTLATLPASEFPSVDPIQNGITLEIPQNQLKLLIDRTNFAMAQQDVRYYLNGLMLELTASRIRAVATDGHRLSMCELELEHEGIEDTQVIIPRKGVMELVKLLADSDEPVKLTVGTNHIKVDLANEIFTSKLIDGRFPDYQRVLPKGGDKVVTGDCKAIIQALSRASILSNEKYRGIRLNLDKDVIRIYANNPEQEEAEEEVEVSYQGDDLEIGFNANYILDALNAIVDDQVKIIFTDANSSCLIQDANNDACKYVVMPMRL